MTAVLGINAFHGDSSAALVVDGEVVAAVEEERFRRIKHWAGFPSESVRYCLQAGGLSLGDLPHVAINSDRGAHRWRKVAHVLRKHPSPRWIAERLRNKRKRMAVRDYLAESFPDAAFSGEVHHVEHHLAHMASAFLVSPFDEAGIISVDGFGDFSSGALGFGSGDDIAIDQRVFYPHSLGVFYQAMTQFIGFPHYGDEYKVMGLAPYGKPVFMEQMRQIVPLQGDGTFRLNLEYFRHDKEAVKYTWENGSPEIGTMFGDALAELLGPPRDPGGELTQRERDIAHSVQAMYEEAFFHMLASMHRRRPTNALTIAGGCGMNSVANGKVVRRSPYRQVYIQSAAGDAGGAIGAAAAVSSRLGIGRAAPMTHAYLGPGYGVDEVEAVIAGAENQLTQASVNVIRPESEQALCDLVAERIANGQVIGWFQGRLEWGPRALGNRSILADPRRADMKDILNLKIKRRESFRPFAPSILRERTLEWFEEENDVPFMMQVFQIREDKRAEIPAVTHADGSGRLQTVDETTNPRYHRLISAFGQRTGVPIVLNTSFNENEPVVCHPQEAMNCFLRTNMDVLVLGDVVMSRGAQSGGG